MAFVNVGTENNVPIELYYTDHGSGRPVVLIHGWPLSGASWEAQEAALVEAGYRVITYDRRGFSMGGGEVVRYVARHGDNGRVGRIVLAAAVPPYLYKSDDNPDGGLDDATIEAFEGGVQADRLAFLEEFTTTFFSANGELKTSEDQRLYAKSIAAGASPKGTLDCITAFGRTDLREDVAAVGVPALVIHGDADAIVPFEVSGRRSAEAIPDAELVVIEGGPHAINATHPQQFNAALLEFLGK
jgi:non-heme chloroperoxidase